MNGENDEACYYHLDNGRIIEASKVKFWTEKKANGVRDNFPRVDFRAIDAKAPPRAKEPPKKQLYNSPGHAVFWHALGRIGGGKVGGVSYTARKCYEQALECDPTFGNAWEGQGAGPGV